MQAILFLRAPMIIGQEEITTIVAEIEEHNPSSFSVVAKTLRGEKLYTHYSHAVVAECVDSAMPLLRNAEGNLLPGVIDDRPAT